MNTYYNIYRDNTIELVRSLIYKCDFIAKCFNREQQDYGIGIPYDKEDWRYYKHLAGEYHQMDVDMIILSLDTGKEIVFNKDNLKLHKKTRNFYKSDIKYIKELSARYPKQSILVTGVLWPQDKRVTINAEDGTILHYNSRYIEPQETQLIPELEKHLKGLLYRINMDSYVIAEELTAASICTQLDLGLVLGTLQIRDRYVKSIYTNSYHIANYLAQYNRLDQFIDYLTYEQQLFLYMNIEYIVRHTGMNSNFDLLVEKLLTLRTLPAFDYEIRQLTTNFEDKLSPTPIFVKNKLNLTSKINVRDLDLWPFDDVIYKEKSEAKNNPELYGEYLRDAKYRSSISKYSNLPTKLVEVSAVDPEDVQTVKFEQVLLNEWMYHACNGTYEATTTLINPLNGDPIKLDARSAFMIFWYSMHRGYNGYILDEILPTKAFDVAKYWWIPESEYRKLLIKDPFNLCEDDIDLFINSNLELTENMILPAELYERANHLATNARSRKIYIHNGQDIEEKTLRETLYEHSYFDAWCDFDRLTQHKTYENLLTSFGLEFERYDIGTWQLIASEILEKATALASNKSISLRDIQKQMVELTKRLSSYTIQFIRETISDETMTVENTIVLPGDTIQSQTSDMYLHLPDIEAREIEQSSVSEVDCIMPSLAVIDLDLPNNLSFEIDISLDVDCSPSTTIDVFGLIDNLTVESFDAK